ncbi:hypothetical protein A2U01_0016190, partial [Trifolium medium]|nr:hypothetical protein [Trifolium medium]
MIGFSTTSRGSWRLRWILSNEFRGNGIMPIVRMSMESEGLYAVVIFPAMCCCPGVFCFCCVDAIGPAIYGAEYKLFVCSCYWCLWLLA